jgi:cobalamin biosynthesis protein CobT
MIRKELLQNAQQVVAAGLLGEGVKVVYDATTPHADLKRRVMHLCPLPEEVDDTSLLHLRADCDHEMGHFGATDPDVMAQAKRPFVRLILNAVEDGRIERWVSDRWLGCGQNLEQSNEHVFADMRAQARRSAESKRARAVSSLLILAHGKDKAAAIEAVGKDVEPILDEIDDLIPAIQSLSSTAAALDVAKQIAERWRWGNASTKPKRAPKPSEEDKGKTDPTDGETPVSADENKTASEQEWEEDPGFRQREDRTAKRLESKMPGARRKQLITEMKPVRHSYLAYTDEDVVGRFKRAPKPETLEFINSVREVVPPLRRRLLMEFRGVGHRMVHAQRRGSVDRSALHLLAIGNDRIFEQEQPHDVVDADVTLLVDISGSMTHHVTEDYTKIYVAAQAACAFSMVLDLIGVSHECLAFTTTAGYGRAVRKIEPQGPYQRVRPLQHWVVKDVNQRFRDARASFAALAETEACVENVDGESLLWAARRLAAHNRPGMKPVLIVFSDGEPASVPEREYTLSAHLRRSIERIEKAGIATLGVGIQSQAVRSFYKNHIVIGDVTDLVGSSYAIIRSVLRSAVRKPA